MSTSARTLKRQTKSLNNMVLEAPVLLKVEKQDYQSTVDSRLFSSTPEQKEDDIAFELQQFEPEDERKRNFRKRNRVLSRNSSKYSITSLHCKRRFGHSEAGLNYHDSTAIKESPGCLGTSVSTIYDAVMEKRFRDGMQVDSDLDREANIDDFSMESSCSDLKHRTIWTRQNVLDDLSRDDEVASSSTSSRPTSRAEEKKECRKQLRLRKLREKQRNELASIASSNDALQKAVTALYANVLVILGFALPLSEVISTNIEEDFFQMFYVYLYLGSLLFLIFIYIDRLQSRTRKAVFDFRRSKKSITSKVQDLSSNVSGRDTAKQSTTSNSAGETEPALRPMYSEENIQAAYGSFYLRLGTVLFGIGSLIYTGIEVGGIFEVGMMKSNSSCRDFISIVRPGLQIIFIFSQMYFIFLNQRMNVYKHKLVGRFGLMHMIATNLCVWLKVLILETKHEIDISHFNISLQDSPVHLASTNLSFPELVSLDVHHDHVEHDEHASKTVDQLNHEHHHSETMEHRGHHGEHSCNNKIMNKLLEDSSPFLFPCTIEFSLICAAVLFIMWKNVSVEHDQFKQEKMRRVIQEKESDSTQQTLQSRRHQMYSVDCSHANTGLFCGIVVVVVTIISLIIFFVFISNENPNIRHIAVQVASVTELTLYSLTTLAVLIGLCQMRRLWYDVTRKLELDNLLLVIAQTGVFIYAAFSIIGTFFRLEEHLIAFLASLATLVQTTLQTVFILDASCRFAYTSLQVREKPGREIVTFLLVCNLAMWLLNTLETNRADSHPIQVEFYGGAWAWPMITHISMPLAIFYRFHSTVCLFEIWKKSFKYKPSHINYV